MSVPEFAARARPIVVPPYNPIRPYSLADEARLFIRVLSAAGREPALLLYSSRGRLYPEILALLVLSLWPRRWRPRVVLSGPMWQPNTGWRHLAERLIVRLADRVIQRYAVQSSLELTTMPANWGIDPDKARFVPYMYTLTESEAQAAPTDAGHIFAGGNSHRDYAPLVAAARQLPEQRFILATHRLHDQADLPANVQAGTVPHAEFVRLLQSARIVVVPMQTELRRAVGQQTYLNALRLGKPTIVSDAVGVRDYVRPGSTGLIVDGSPHSYELALRWVLDPANATAVQQMTAAGQAEAETRFSQRSHALRLLEIMDEVLAAGGSV